MKIIAFNALRKSTDKKTLLKRYDQYMRSEGKELSGHVAEKAQDIYYQDPYLYLRPN